MENINCITQINIIILAIFALEIIWITLKFIANIIDAIVHKIFGNPWEKRPMQHPARIKRKEERKKENKDE